MNKGFIKTLAILALFLSGTAVHAHTGIATTVPGHDEILDRAPTLLHFTFPGKVTITNTRILPVDDIGIQSGDTVDIRLPRNRIGQSTAFGKEIDLDIPLLGPGRYKVVFQAVTIDGHTMADDFMFEIADGLR